MKFVTAIIKPFELDEVCEALSAIGITGLIVPVSRPAVPLRTAPSYSPTCNRFHVVDWHSLSKAA